MKVVANIKTNDGLWKCKNVWYISSKLQLIPLLGTATKMIQITWYLSVKIGLNIYTFKTVVKCSLWVNFTAFYLIPNLFQTFHSYLLMLPDLMTEHWQIVWDEVQMIDQEQAGDVVSDMDMTLVHCSRLSWCNQCILVIMWPIYHSCCVMRCLCCSAFVDMMFLLHMQLISFF